MGMTTWDKIVSGNELAKVEKRRKLPYITEDIFPSGLQDAENEGYVLLRELKSKKRIRVKKDKKQEEVFEDRVWLLFVNMGFTDMSSDRNFVMSYGNGDSETQQIDVFAVDDETIIFVECKSAVEVKKGDFKKDINQLSAERVGLMQEAKKQYKNRKCKFIFATHNYIIGDADKEKMKESQIIHFDDQTITYYEELVKHLGTAARYQFLGNICANETIPNMENCVPAIKGKMGNHDYYSFLIEPEKLLKIGYVLHRSKANSEMMPTYQRIIKKNRLKAVKKFINEEHGYFPNSIIISIDSKKKMQFDQSDKQVDGSIPKLGVLHLPKQYRSAYIIDGQHRLYGYTDSKYAEKNSIPVVAFENLPQEEQVKLFMEINENQKSVSKNLRNTLNSDMLWASEKEQERREAVCLRIAQKLGESSSSPLYERIVIGEDKETGKKCITIECIRQSLLSGDFLNKYDNKDKLVQVGIVEQKDLDITYDKLYEVIEKSLNYIYNQSSEEWEKGKSESGVLTTNNGIGGLIRTINDLIDFLQSEGTVNPLTDSPNDIVKAEEYYLDPVARFINSLSDETREDMKTTYGAKGPKHSWRYFQKAIFEEHNEFKPEGLEKYWEDNGKEYNAETLRMLPKIEETIKDYIRETLEDNYSNWIKEIPQSVYTSANSKVADYKYSTGEDKDWWEYVGLADCKEIILAGRHWSEFFSDKFTLLSQEKTAGRKESKTEWLSTIERLQKKAGKANFSVSKEEFRMVSEVYALFAGDE